MVKGLVAATVVGAAVILMTGGLLAQSSMTPIFRMDCGNGAYPNCGWPILRETSNGVYVRTLAAGAGPGGVDAVQYTFNPISSSAWAQYYLGWSNPRAEASPAPQGSVRYVRYRIYIAPGMRANGIGGETWGAKLWILGDDGNNDNVSRVIGTMQPKFSNSDLHIMASRNIDGQPGNTGQINVPIGTWSSHQFEIRSSSRAGVADARLATWLNNDNYSSPSARTTSGFELLTSDWTNVQFGFYAGPPIGTNGSLTIRYCCYEYDDQFDPTWASRDTNGGTGGTTGSPAAPSNVRLVTP